MGGLEFYKRLNGSQNNFFAFEGSVASVEVIKQTNKKTKNI